MATDTITVELPRDHYGNPVQLTQDSAALARTRNTSLTTTTSEITLNSGTSIIEVQAIGIDIALKYGTDDVTLLNFDEYIQDGHVRHYVLPKTSLGANTNVTAINIIATSGTGTAIVIEK